MKEEEAEVLQQQYHDVTHRDDEIDDADDEKKDDDSNKDDSSDKNRGAQRVFPDPRLNAISLCAYSSAQVFPSSEQGEKKALPPAKKILQTVGRRRFEGLMLPM